MRPAFILPLLLLSPAALAQDAVPVGAAPATAEEEAIGAQRGDILVVGTRYVGQVEAAQPPLMVLNEPETSLHPDLLPALARLILEASKWSQLWIVSHSARLIAALEDSGSCNSLRLAKDMGETQIVGQELLETPSWQWPAR